jgi:hypothetical protein
VLKRVCQSFLLCGEPEIRLLMKMRSVWWRGLVGSARLSRKRWPKLGGRSAGGGAVRDDGADGKGSHQGPISALHYSCGSRSSAPDAYHLYRATLHQYRHLQTDGPPTLQSTTNLLVNVRQEAIN